MAMYEDGEVIDLVWGGQREFMYVKGWHDSERAVDLLNQYYGGDYEFSDPTPELARWSMDHREGEWMHVLRNEKVKGRGVFKVMRATVIGERK